MTDQYIKDKLFELWARYWVSHGPFTLTHYSKYLKSQHDYKTIREIKALMRKDGVPADEINKIIGV